MRLVNPKWEGYTWEILRDFKEESPAVSLLYWVSLTRIARDKNSSACVRHACAPSTVHISHLGVRGSWCRVFDVLRLHILYFR